MAESSKKQTRIERPPGIPQSLPLDLIPPEFNNVLRQALNAYEQGDLATASNICAQIVRACPSHILALEYLGLIARDMGNNKAALNVFNGIRQIAPGYGRALTRIAGVYIHMQKIDEARPCLDKAMELDPDDSHTHSTFALYHDAKGDKDSAKKHYARAYELDPDNHMIFFKYLDNAHKIKDPKDKNLKKLHELEARADILPPATRQRLYACLHKPYERFGDYDKSFAYMKKAADDKRATVSYDIETIILKTSYIREFFTEDYVAANKNGGLETKLPVFVLGMPRSGTTLIEQILHSHKDIYGIGEDPALDDMCENFDCLPPSGMFQPYAKHINPNAQTISRQAFGQKYIDHLKSRAPQARRIINKSMATHNWIGKILLTMPQAKFIYCRRNPLDCCLSCYTHHFRDNAQLFSYNLTELGLYYRIHTELMQFWMDLFPDNILETVYEDVVDDLENQTRRLLDFLEMPWDENCMDFHKTKKTVMTASKDQVRKPIYTSSIGKWKNYAAHLAPLIEALGPCAPENSLYILKQNQK